MGGSIGAAAGSPGASAGSPRSARIGAACSSHRSLLTDFRRRRGLDRRLTRDDDLIPWLLNPEHRWLYPVVMLRAEARRRDGKELSADEAKRLATWKQMLAENDAVVHYDPDTEDGFHYVPRGAGDHDLIHEPEVKTTTRPRVD